MKLAGGYFTLVLFFEFVSVFCAVGQQQSVNVENVVVGFYNVENLYDTLDDRFKNDDDFTPKGILRWNGERYKLKIAHLARVISEIGTAYNPQGLALLGLCEVENKSVLMDLVKSEAIKQKQYQFILIEGPDARGVDPALIYNPSMFKIRTAQSFGVQLSDSAHKTRDILLVTGELKGENVAVLVNHWPSRRGGELRSRDSRNRAGRKARQIADSLKLQMPAIKIIIMGDLNDDPVNDCVKKYVGTFSDIEKVERGKYFNPMEKLFLKGIGTLAYQDRWNLFDQILLSEDWVTGKGLKFKEVRINNKIYLRADYGNFKSYPFRTYSGGIYTGGYSDHFASYVIFSGE